MLSVFLSRYILQPCGMQLLSVFDTLFLYSVLDLLNYVVFHIRWR